MSNIIDDNIFGTAETVKCFMDVKLQECGMPHYLTEEIAQMCSTWFIRGYEYALSDNKQLELNRILFTKK